MYQVVIFLLGTLLLPVTVFPAILTVTKVGTGTGIATASGINCGSDCSENYPSGTKVTLSAAASGCSVFTGWGDSTGTSVCEGYISCIVTMDQAHTDVVK